MNIKTVLKIYLTFCFFINLSLAQNNITIIPDLDNPGSLSQWRFDGSGLWKISNGELILYKSGKPSGSIRKPSALAILKSGPLKNIEVEAEIKSTVDTTVIRRDLDFIVSYESPQLFYYIHLAGTADSVHNGIFIVNNSNRKRIDPGKGKPQLKDKNWHFVKILRNGDDGTIDVYVDKSKIPVLSAVDKTICCGEAGVGSFDDTGIFRNIKITGTTKIK
jgi:hypothetical protein